MARSSDSNAHARSSARRRGVRPALVALLVVLLSATASPALARVASAATSRHPGPSVWADIKFDLDAGEMLLVVEGAADPLTTNLAYDELLLGPVDAEARARAEHHIARQFRDGFEMLVDGEHRIPTLKELFLQDGIPEEANFKSARITLAYPCRELPRSIALTWERFEGEGIEFIPVVVHVPDLVPDMFSLWPDEPQHIWHSEDVRPRQRRELTVPEVARSGRVSLPFPSVLFALAGTIVALVGWGTSLRRLLAPVGLGMIVAATLVLDRGQVEVTVPWATKVALPSPEQATQIFEALQGSVYSAFDAKTEDQIYDRLAVSVDASILDDLYGDVYESLILREQGGAICEIEQVEKIAGEVSAASYTENDQPEFHVDWEWNVFGIVSHFGHIHRRMNHYVADYVVRHDGASWKIRGVTIREHERVEDFE